MEVTQSKIQSNLPKNPSKSLFVTKILLRLMAFVTSLIAIGIMATNKQTVNVFTFQVQAKFSDSPAFSFLVGANGVASLYALLSIPLDFALKSGSPFFIQLLDLMIMGLVLGASSAAAAIGYVGKKGNTHAGWSPICDQLGKFCDKAGGAMACSFASFVLFFLITLLSLNKPNPVDMATA